jgi:uncharacterized protein YjeT (DUF2065 family)
MAASATPRDARPGAAAPSDVAGIVLLVAGTVLVLPGILAFVAPGAFYDQLAGYAPRNDHFLRDLGAFQIGLGAFAVLAWARPQLRAGALAVLALHFLLHTISHVIDVSAADPEWQGPFALVAEGLLTAVLAALLVREVRR